MGSDVHYMVLGRARLRKFMCGESMRIVQICQSLHRSQMHMQACFCKASTVQGRFFTCCVHLRSGRCKCSQNLDGIDR